MRPESKKKIRIGETVIGGTAPLICLPLVAKEKTELLQQAEKIMLLAPDILEWRVDALNNFDVAFCMELLHDLAAISGKTPLIFTCRAFFEGGFQDIAQNVREQLYLAAIESGRVQLVDIELASGEECIKGIKEKAASQGTQLILSHHNFTETPTESFIVDTLVSAGEKGAGIAKIAVTPKEYGDVLTLLKATYIARTEKIDIPLITIAMGDMGKITRLAGGLFGSDITFATGQESSAPGQIPIAAMRGCMPLLFNKK